MKVKKLHTGFTLIELIVAITIFAIIMVSVVSIFIFSSQMSTRVELGRVMQENIKNVMEDIAEEVRKGNIEDISPAIGDDCSPVTLPLTHSFSSGDSGDKLCLGGNIKYVLGNKNALGNWSRVNPIECSDYDEDDESVCRVLKSTGGDYYPITSSFIAVESLTFTLTNDVVPKVMVQMSVRPAYKKGIASVVIDSYSFEVQTTISERFIETQ